MEGLEFGVHVHDLGGLVTPLGVTQPHRFLRSGTTQDLSDADLQVLYNYGVRRVVDLRGEAEVRRWPDRFCGYRDVRYKNIPLLNRDISAPGTDYGDDLVGFYTSNYLRMLANHAGVRGIFTYFSRQRGQGCVLFHCTAGLDRTGIVSLLLLGLAGASKRQMMEDYLRALAPADELDAILDRVLDGEKDMTTLADDDSGEMLLAQVASRVIDTLLERHGSIEGYLQACNLSPRRQKLLKHRLLDA